MRLPVKVLGLARKIEVMRQGVNFARVCGGQYDEASWRKRTRLVDLAPVLFNLRREPDPLRRLEPLIDAMPRVSRALNGKRPLHFEQLIKLAEHFGLAGIVGDAQEAAALLCDDVSEDEFKRRLVVSGWSAPSFQHSPYATRRGVLAEFERVAPLTRGGLTIEPEAGARRTTRGPRRGAGIPESALADEGLVDWELGARVKFRLDVAKPTGLLLFEVHPTFGEGTRYGVACLAPSTMVPSPIVEPSRGSVLVPRARAGDPHESFELKEPLGRQDLVALLTDPPIDVPWPSEPDRLYEPTAFELRALLGRIIDRVKARALTVEIRHLPYRIIGSGRR